MRAIPKFIGEVIVSIVVTIIDKLANAIIKRKQKKTI
jgi:hypothetical protein